MRKFIAGLEPTLSADYKRGIMLGSVIAIVISWDLNHSVWDAIWASILGWIYVGYNTLGWWAACGAVLLWCGRAWVVGRAALKKSDLRKQALLALNHPDAKNIDPEPTRLSKPDGTRWADWDEFSFALRAWDRRQTLREMRVERLEAEAAAEAAATDD